MIHVDLGAWGVDVGHHEPEAVAKPPTLAEVLDAAAAASSDNRAEEASKDLIVAGVIDPIAILEQQLQTVLNRLPPCHVPVKYKTTLHTILFLQKAVDALRSMVTKEQLGDATVDINSNIKVIEVARDSTKSSKVALRKHKELMQKNRKSTETQQAQKQVKDELEAQKSETAARLARAEDPLSQQKAGAVVQVDLSSPHYNVVHVISQVTSDTDLLASKEPCICVGSKAIEEWSSLKVVCDVMNSFGANYKKSRQFLETSKHSERMPIASIKCVTATKQLFDHLSEKGEPVDLTPVSKTIATGFFMHGFKPRALASFIVPNLVGMVRIQFLGAVSVSTVSLRNFLKFADMSDVKSKG